MLPMIESGDMGKAVEVWQKIVGTTEDCEFGLKTKAATLVFQKAYKLEVGGIAGRRAGERGIGHWSKTRTAYGETLWPSFFVCR